VGQRSKVELLPDEVRKDLEQRLIAGSFSDYEQLADWLKDQGFAISKSSLHRWGSTFEEKCAGMKIATEQARAIVEASPDKEGAMGMALTRLVQEKLFGVLLDLQINPKDLPLPKLTRAIADLSRAGVSQLKHAAEVRKAAREELVREQQAQLASIVKQGGISEETADTFRRQILGLE
jgi:hypothetical protein